MSEEKKPRTKKEPNPENPVYAECVRIWLKEIHPGFTFGAMHGGKMKSIIKKIKQVCVFAGLEGTDDQVVNSFKKMCLQLPEWFKDKDLQVIDAKFNEIVVQIQAGKKTNAYQQMNSKHRFSDYN